MTITEPDRKSEPYDGYPVPKPVNHRATLYAQVGESAARSYTVRTTNHLDNPIEYDGRNLHEAVLALMAIHERGHRGTMTEEIVYRAFTRPDDWIGAAHECGCIEPPRSDHDLTLGVSLSMAAGPSGPYMVRTCEAGRAIWSGVEQARADLPDFDDPGYEAAVRLIYRAWSGHLGRENNA